jgi:hypothetical protein
MSRETSPAVSRCAGSRSNPACSFPMIRKPASCLLGTCATSGFDLMPWPAQCASDRCCHFDFGITTVITFRVIMRGDLAHVSDVSHQLLPQSAAATATVAHDAGVVAEMLGGLSPSPLFFKYRACSLPRASPTSPISSSFSFLSPARSCCPLAVPLPAMTRSRRGARRRSRRRRRHLPHPGNAVARKGAATRAPWRPSQRRPPLLPPPPSCPRRPELPATQASRRNRGPAVRRGAGRRLLP